MLDKVLYLGIFNGRVVLLSLWYITFPTVLDTKTVKILKRT